MRPSSFCGIRTPLTAVGCWRRYSNTLLVSLNNRISIREAPAREAGVGSPAITVPVTSHPRVPSGVVHVELEKPSAAMRRWPSGDGSGRDSGSVRVIGEQYGWQPFLSSACCLTHPGAVDIA